MSSTRVECVDRREFVLGAGAAMAVLAFLGSSAPVLAQDARLPSFEEYFKKLVGEAKPSEGKVVIDMPEIAENGNTVPFSISVESPMTDKDYVKTVHVLSTGNPQANVAAFSFTPLSGKAAVSSRMRLAKTQDIVAVAELSDGKLVMAKRTIKVTIGGCGG